jgi:hypothetical protein
MPKTEALIDEALFKELCVHMFVEAREVTICSSLLLGLLVSVVLFVL